MACKTRRLRRHLIQAQIQRTPRKTAVKSKNMPQPPAPIPVADCLLVVDDDESEIEMLQTMLGGLGFEVVPASNADEAFARINARRPDLILLDLIMPDLDGLQICHRIQENADWADIPIIFLSAVDDKDLITRALEGGGVDYLTKPFHRHELLSRVRTHLMLNTAREHLKRLARDKEELLGMISHYLQNHLAGMQMSAGLLMDRVGASGDPKMRLMAQNIQNSTTQMRAFIRSLLANAAADRGVEIRLEPVHFTEAATRAVSRYEGAARSKNLALNAAFHHPSGVIQADPTALDQIFDNLISNAVKFSPPGKEVTVTVKRERQKVECHVCDQGPGFTDEDKSRMFHRYARLSARPTGGEPSTGLGLSITKKLVESMNGELTCQSAAGRGATFVLRFPVHPAHE